MRPNKGATKQAYCALQGLTSAPVNVSEQLSHYPSWTTTQTAMTWCYCYCRQGWPCPLLRSHGMMSWTSNHLTASGRRSSRPLSDLPSRLICEVDSSARCRVLHPSVASLAGKYYECFFGLWFNVTPCVWCSRFTVHPWLYIKPHFRWILLKYVFCALF